MGFMSFLKQVFSLNPQEEAELQRLREKHGITTDEKEAETPHGKKNTPGDKDYDVWEDIHNFRANYFLGSWATRKFRPVGEEKVKKQLEELEKKRKQEEEEKRGEGSGK